MHANIPLRFQGHGKIGIPGITGLVVGLCLFTIAPALFAQPTAATKADSGWVPLYNGANFDSFYIFSKTAPQLRTGAAMSSQTIYRVGDSGQIYSPRLAEQYQLITTREYSYYKVRIDYRWGAVNGSQNAGLILHIDNQQGLSGTMPLGTLRPRSIEVQMLRTDNSPFTLWSGWELGPYITTTVQTGTANYLTGGTVWTNDPWGSRTIYTTVANPEKPVGQWNTGEARMYGDSGSFWLNGVLRTRGWNFQARVNATSSMPRVRYAKGGIGLQQEDNEIWYRNFEIMELDSATLLPVHARRGCTNAAFANYDNRALVDNGTCSATAIRAATGNTTSRRNEASMLWLDPAALESLLRSAPGGFHKLLLYDLDGRQAGAFPVSTAGAPGTMAFRSGVYFARWVAAH
jgi:hypothetical protein